MTLPVDDDFALVRSDIRYRDGGLFRTRGYIETADGMVRVRTKDGEQVCAPISTLQSARGSWWRPGWFGFEVTGRRHRMAASIRGGPDATRSSWFTDIDVIDFVLLFGYVLLSPVMAVYLIRTRRRWLRILRGQLDPAPLAQAERARRTPKAKPAA